MSEYVTGILFNEGLDKVALITEEQSEKHKGNYGLVGGEVLGVEDCFSAMARHIMGDLGIWVDQDLWIMAGGIVNKGHSVMILTAATDKVLEGEYLPDDRELLIADLNNLPDNMLRNVPELIFQALSAIQKAQELGDI